MANAVVKSITLEITCGGAICGKTYTHMTEEVKEGNHTCDCDYPCSCENGPFKYVDSVCPHCGYENRVLIAKL